MLLRGERYAIPIRCAALAPNVPRNGPLMLAPPSYVMSPNKLTMPIVNTKVNAGEEDSARNCFFTSPVYFGVNCARS